jgi:hypothetical protein
VITDIFDTWVWAANSSYTLTVYTDGRTVTAQISLARVQTAFDGVRAFIREYCYWAGSDVVLCAHNPNPDDVNNTRSAMRIPQAQNVTFELQAPSSFAYAVIMVFFHG